MLAFNLIVLVYAGFQGLAICILAGMLDMGFAPGYSLASAVVMVIIGAVLTRAMYLKTYAR